MDSSISPKDKIWFLCVCHHISTGLCSNTAIFLAHHTFINKGSVLLGWHCAVGWLVLHMSKDGVAFTFNSKQSKMTYCPWRWRQCNPLTYHKPVIQWHSNTFYKTWMLHDNIKSCQSFIYSPTDALMSCLKKQYWNLHQNTSDSLTTAEQCNRQTPIRT